MSCWYYKGKCLNEIPEGYHGYVYKITDDQGRIYYGKKAFTHKKKTKLSKKARVGTRKRVKVEQVDSKWLSYWGSCKPLLEYIQTNGTQGFRREILTLCKTKQDLTYRELEILVKENVLFREDCWNSNILSRFFKGKINQ